MAADAYLWLDNQLEHCRSLLEAAWLLLGSASPERLVRALQLIALARNQRLLDWRPPQLPERDAEGAERFERYPPQRTGHDTGRFTKLEQTLFEGTHRAWAMARGRGQTSEDPGAAVAHGYFLRYAAGFQHHFKTSNLQIELDDVPGSAVDRLFTLVQEHYEEPVGTRILDFGCGPGDEARRLATKNHDVWAVDSPVWFAASRAADKAGARIAFIEWDPLDYARHICAKAPPEGSPDQVDVVLFRCSLCRVSQRNVLLAAAHRLLRPGGLVLTIDWVQTRTTDRISWARLLDTMRFVDLETEPGYRQLCKEAGFTQFTSWTWQDVARAAEPAMRRFFQRRLDETRQALGDERSDRRLPPDDRAFLLRARRDLEMLTEMSTPEGPLGWLFWSARKPEPR